MSTATRRVPQTKPDRIDPITTSVIQGALENIAVEMGYKLMRMSYSSIIRESEDFGAALVDAEGRGLAESAQSTPLQSGPIPGYVRGVQRILKEHGIKSVQGLADNTAAVSFGAIEEAVGQSLLENGDDEPGLHDEDEDFEGGDDGEGIDFRFVETEEDLLATFRGSPAQARATTPATAPADRERLEGVLKELLACRQMLDKALKDG